MGGLATQERRETSHGQREGGSGWLGWCTYPPDPYIGPCPGPNDSDPLSSKSCSVADKKHSFTSLQSDRVIGFGFIIETADRGSSWKKKVNAGI